MNGISCVLSQQRKRWAEACATRYSSEAFPKCTPETMGDLTPLFCLILQAVPRTNWS